MVIKLNAKDAEDFFRKAPVGQKQYEKPIGPTRPERKSAWQRIREGASSLSERAKPLARKTLEWAENHPSNRRSRSRREPREPRERKERAPSRIERYEDGKVKEVLYFSTNEQTPRVERARKTKRGRRDVLGGLGSNLNMSDFIPSSMGLGSTMGYPPLPFESGDPMRKSKRKKSSAQNPRGSWMDPDYIPPELRDFF